MSAHGGALTAALPRVKAYWVGPCFVAAWSAIMPVLELFCLGLGVLVMVIAIPPLARAMRRRVEAAEASLASCGYVIESSRYKPIGDMTRLWAKFETPTPLYLQVFNLDPVGNLAGLAGIADLRLGVPDFDNAFVVRASHPAEARLVLDEDTRRLLLKQGTLRFRTGSIDSLLGADYFPEEKSNRDLRQYWMLEVKGRPEDVNAEALLALGRHMAAKVAAVSGALVEPDKLRTRFLEGR